MPNDAGQHLARGDADAVAQRQRVDMALRAGDLMGGANGVERIIEGEEDASPMYFRMRPPCCTILSPAVR